VSLTGKRPLIAGWRRSSSEQFRDDDCVCAFFTEEKLNSWKLIGFLIGFIGIVILFLPKELSVSLVADWQAQLLILGGSVLYAITRIIASRPPETPSPLGVSMMLTLGAVKSTIYAVAVAGLPPMPDMADIRRAFCNSTGRNPVAVWARD